MKHFSCKENRWHAWEATKGILLSDESVKKLRQFGTIDDVVNWLYTNGQRDVARELNKHWSKQK